MKRLRAEQSCNFRITFCGRAKKKKKGKTSLWGYETWEILRILNYSLIIPNPGKFSYSRGNQWLTLIGMIWTLMVQIKICPSLYEFMDYIIIQSQNIVNQLSKYWYLHKVDLHKCIFILWKFNFKYSSKKKFKT